MLVIGTFSSDLKNDIEASLSELSQHLEIRLLDKQTRIEDYDIKLLEDLDGIITKRLTNKECVRLTNLSFIIVPMTGLDGLDEEILNNENITIYNMHSIAPYIAERGMGILMTLAGKIHTQDKYLKEGIWNRGGDSNRWLTLRDKKVGIYGYGHIGKSFEKMIRTFTSNIYVIDRQKEYSEQVYLVNNLEELTKEADVLFIAVPGNNGTKGTIGEHELNNLKDGLVINVGRGSVVDQEALYEALRDEVIAGYGSDVWYNYPSKNSETCMVSDEELERFEHVVMTPHNAWNHDHKDGLILNEMIDYIRQLVSNQ